MQHQPSTSQTPDSGSEFDIAELLQLLKDYRWLISGTVALVVLVGLFWTLRLPKIYEATCSLEYDPNPSRPLGRNIEDVADPISNFWASREFFQTQNKVIGSREVAERAVTSLGLHKDPMFVSDEEEASVEKIAIALQSSVRVDPVPDTRIVKIHSRNESPERAQQIADAIADAYVQKTIDHRNAITEDAVDVIERQLVRLRTDLEFAEQELHEYKKKNNVLSVSMEDRQNFVVLDIEAINQKLTEVRNNRIEQTARVRRLKTSLDVDLEDLDPVLGDQHPVLGELMVDLRARRKESLGLAMRYGAEHPKMKELKKADIVFAVPIANRETHPSQVCPGRSWSGKSRRDRPPRRSKRGEYSRPSIERTWGQI